MKNKGFTLIELIIVIMIIAILSGIILFSTALYINKGKDSNVAGNLAILIPAGEVFYNGNGNSYNDSLASFCNPAQNSVLNNAISQMPKQSSGAPCYTSSTTPTSTTNIAGVCCYAQSQAWAACARKFASVGTYYCVDSRGIRKEVTGTCNFVSTATTQCP
jgi:prepilin-type N-terminal cleavage/methylation domain-containing protein